MVWDFGFFMTAILFGVGLAMDAFSVSVTNGLNEPCMKRRRMAAIALIFAVYQALMPMIGWFCVHNLLEQFQWFEKFIPWIALVLLSYIGGKMLWEGFHCEGGEDCACKARASFGALMVQGIATSIDALSVGLDTAAYDVLHAVVCSLIIAAVTFVICLAGVYIGRKVGDKLSGKSAILGGAILIFIGLEIFLTGIFG